MRTAVLLGNTANKTLHAQHRRLCDFIINTIGVMGDNVIPFQTYSELRATQTFRSEFRTQGKIENVHHPHWLRHNET